MASTGKKSRGIEGYLEDVVEHYLNVSSGSSSQYTKIERRGLRNSPGADGHAGDGGRDFEVKINENAVNPYLFGEPVKPGKTYYVEVKHSKNNVDYANISTNISRIHDKAGWEGVFLVTNSYMRPTDAFNIELNFPKLKGKFLYVDGCSLFHCFNEKGVAPRDILKKVEPKYASDVDDLFVTEYIRKIRHQNKYVYEITLLIHNRSLEDKSIVVFSQSDISWKFRDNNENEGEVSSAHFTENKFNKTVHVPKNCNRTLRILGHAADPTSDSAANLILKTGKHKTRIISKKKFDSFDFQLAFFGESNNLLLDNFKNQLDIFCGKNLEASPNFKVFHIHGAAGVGKSRVLEEALPKFYESNVLILNYKIDPKTKASTKHKNFDALKSALNERIYTVEDEPLTWLDEINSEVSLLQAVLQEFQEYTTLGNWGSVICILEDMHHATPELCDYVSKLLNDDISVNINTVFILTGRSDDTFVNSAYSELQKEIKENDVFINLKKQLAKVSDIEVRPLQDLEAKDLIKQVIKGIQPSGIDRIFRISGSIPQHIIQCIEYMLDECLLAIDSREALSILDLYTFESRAETLPPDVEELYFLRLQNLLSIEYGLDAFNALFTAIFYGARFSENICNLDDNEVFRTQLIKKILTERRFFKVANECDELEWSHENVEIFFSKIWQSCLQGDNFNRHVDDIYPKLLENARRLYNKPEVTKFINPLFVGDFAVISDDYKTAKDIFSPVFELAKNQNSFTTLDVDSKWFHHIESSINLLWDDEKNECRELVWRLLCVKLYIGAFHLGLRFGISAYQYAMKLLPEIGLDQETYVKAELWIKSIYAHVHMDSGFIGKAFPLFIELQNLLNLSELKDVELEFEIHNCLRLLYIYTNFYFLAENHGKICEKVIRKSENKALEDVDLGDRAFQYMLTDRKRALTILERALVLNKEQGNVRHSWHTEVSIYANQLYDFKADDKWLQKTAKRTDDLINEIKGKKYYSVLPRIYLLAAAISYLKWTHKNYSGPSIPQEALDYAAQGLNSTEAHSIGFISWQLHNLIAVIKLKVNDIDAAVKHFITALELLEKEGLNFLGDGKLVSAVPIVYGNFLKVASTPLLIDESRIHRLLARMHGFQSYNWKHTDLEKNSKKFHHIIGNYPEKPNEIIMDKETKLAVVVWF